ncbi:MAG: hypothetical protein RBR67_04995 [Desulfobacterium sp.]|jgi:hypothetical protein|nr:hypothetical protein [Desulfobacterium sp.]
MKHLYKSFRQRIRLPYAVLMLTFMSFALLSVNGGHKPDCLRSEISSLVFQRVAWADELSGEEIQWFRDEMKISSKFQEHKEGLWGMSWTHFITMVFLIIFFTATIAAIYIRNKQTKKILNTLLKEK